MAVAALTWPAAVVYVALIAGVTTVLAVSIWSIFRTGQTAIKKEIRQDEARRVNSPSEDAARG